MRSILITGLMLLGTISMIGVNLVIQDGRGMNCSPTSSNQKPTTPHPPPPNTSSQVDTTIILPLLHGTTGPIQDSFPPFYDNVYKAWEPTYKNLGLGPTGNPKGGRAVGAYTTLFTIELKNAGKSYAETAYWKPNAGRESLVVLTGAFATRVVFAREEGTLVAPGVSFTVDGETYTASASREVILCAGALQLPQPLGTELEKQICSGHKASRCCMKTPMWVRICKIMFTCPSVSKLRGAR